MGLASRLAAAQYNEAQAQAPSAQYAGAPYGAPPAPQQAGYTPYNAQPPQQGGPQFYNGALGQPPHPTGQYPAVQNQYANPAQSSYQGNPQQKPDVTQSYFNVLQECVEENRLQELYTIEQLRNLANSISRSGSDPIAQVCTKWNIKPEIAFDLVKLALYDTMFLVDDSGSIRFNSLERELKDLLEAAAFATSLFDRDGISIQFFHSNEQGHNITGGSSVHSLIDRVTFARDTPLARATQQKILAPTVEKFKLSQLRKPVHLIIITDGVPTDNTNNEFQKFVQQANAQLNQNGKKLLSIQIAQVGTDKAAAQFLQELDTDPMIGKMIDCTSNFELESEQCLKQGQQIGRSEWYCKLLMGAIDKSYDSNDERSRAAMTTQYNQQNQYGVSGTQPGQISQSTYNQPPRPLQSSQYGQPQQYHGAPPPVGQPGYGGNAYPQQGQPQYQQAPQSQAPYAPQGQYPHQQGPQSQPGYAPQGQYQYQQPPPGQYQQGPPQGHAAYAPQGGYPYPQSQAPPQGQGQYNAQGQPAYGAQAQQQQGQYYVGAAPPPTYNPGNQHKTNR